MMNKDCSMLKLKIAVFLILLFGGLNVATPQYIPPPVNLPIENRLQKTLAGCWVAVAEQVISYLVGPAKTPSQCRLTETALGLNPGACCLTRICDMQLGTLPQIAGLIGLYGRGYSNLMFSKDPYTVYNILSKGHPIVMAVKYNGIMRPGHVIVIRGMAWVPNYYGLQPVLYINDPMSFLPQTIPYANMALYWYSGLEVFY